MYNSCRAIIAMLISGILCAVCLTACSRTNVSETEMPSHPENNRQPSIEQTVPDETEEQMNQLFVPDVTQTVNPTIAPTVPEETNANNTNTTIPADTEPDATNPAVTNPEPTESVPPEKDPGETVPAETESNTTTPSETEPDVTVPSDTEPEETLPEVPEDTRPPIIIEIPEETQPETDYEAYNNMTAEEQKKFYDSFSSPDAFFDWYNKAKAEYENSRGDVVIDGSTNIEIKP